MIPTKAVFHRPDVLDLEQFPLSDLTEFEMGYSKGADASNQKSFYF